MCHCILYRLSMARINHIFQHSICVKCQVHQRHTANESHQSIAGILSQIQFNAQTLILFRMILEKMFDKEGVVKSDEITKTEIDKIIKRLATLQDQFLDGNISPKEYHSMKEKVEIELTGDGHFSCTNKFTNNLI